mmetsp:Transcript_67294/g.146667  ORF Transcript_67294/g.146667 Transcript_67294/m.146667 type:complete len:575 (-) Transcript_67294:116-1840(-)
MSILSAILSIVLLSYLLPADGTKLRGMAVLNATHLRERQEPDAKMVMPFPSGTRCVPDFASPGLQSLGVTTGSMEQCRDLCIAQEACNFVEFQPSLVISEGTCRSLSSCSAQTRVLGDDVLVFKKIPRREFNSPQWMMTCPQPPVMTTRCMSKELYIEATRSVKRIIRKLDTACNSTHCERADFGGCLLRMAGHDFMDFDVATGKGGADACTDMGDPDNAGLPECLFKGEFESKVSLQDAYKLFCDKISLADFVVLAAEAVMAELALGETQDALRIGFRRNFRFGRTTAFEGCEFAVGVLPNPADSCSAVEKVFVKALNLTWDESAALMGVHTIGRAQVQFSGYEGWWSSPQNSATFNNNYFSSMYTKGWCEELNVNGCSDENEAAGKCEKKNQWQRCDILREESGHMHEMMLNTDLCLAYSDQRGGNGQLKAGEDNCCAWVHTNEGFNLSSAIAGDDNNFCNVKCGGKFPGSDETYSCFEASGSQSFREFKACCAFETERKDCRSSGLGAGKGPGGPAAEAVRLFAQDELLWAKLFLTAWKKVTENGFRDSLMELGNCPSDVELVSAEEIEVD